jgi:predicted HD superfamily hydrolase involved in NAD metabolism
MNINVFNFNNNIMNIKQRIRSFLDRSRNEHTIAVAYMAIALAMKYECDIHKAELAGLLHDCAKCVPNDKKLSKCLKHNIPISQLEEKNPHLLHAKLGAFYAMNKYNVYDKDVINAIMRHTTGAPAMTLLEKIVFVADYIEPNRQNIKGLDDIRRIAFEDIDLAVFKILKNNLDYLRNTNAEIDEITIDAYKYYKELYMTRKENFEYDS